MNLPIIVEGPKAEWRNSIKVTNSKSNATFGVAGYQVVASQDVPQELLALGRPGRRRSCDQIKVARPLRSWAPSLLWKVMRRSTI